MHCNASMQSICKVQAIIRNMLPLHWHAAYRFTQKSEKTIFYFEGDNGQKQETGSVRFFILYGDRRGWFLDIIILYNKLFLCKLL